MTRYLEPCPFCGGKAKIENSQDFWRPFAAFCANGECLVRPRTLASSKEGVVEQWNTRAATPSQYSLAVYNGQEWVRQRECVMDDAVEAIFPEVCGDGYDATARAEAIVYKIADMLQAKVVAGRCAT